MFPSVTGHLFIGIVSNSVLPHAIPYRSRHTYIYIIYMYIQGSHESHLYKKYLCLVYQF